MLCTQRELSGDVVAAETEDGLDEADVLTLKEVKDATIARNTNCQLRSVHGLCPTARRPDARVRVWEIHMGCTTEWHKQKVQTNLLDGAQQHRTQGSYCPPKRAATKARGNQSAHGEGTHKQPHQHG